MEPHHDTMRGRHVGVLKYRDYDATLVVSEGGIVVETQGYVFLSNSFQQVFQESKIINQEFIFTGFL